MSESKNQPLPIPIMPRPPMSESNNQPLPAATHTINIPVFLVPAPSLKYQAALLQQEFLLKQNQSLYTENQFLQKKIISLQKQLQDNKNNQHASKQGFFSPRFCRSNFSPSNPTSTKNVYVNADVLDDVAVDALVIL